MGGSIIALFEQRGELYDLVSALMDPYNDPAPQFAAALRARSITTRLQTARLVRGNPSIALVPVLLERLQEEPVPDVLAELVESIGFLRVRDAAPQLLNLSTSRKALIRANVAEALGLIGVRESDVIDVLKLLLADRSRVVRCYAAEALGDIGNAADALEALQLRQKRDRSWLVRVWCVYGRARLGDRIDWSALGKGLSNPEALVRRQSMIVLRHLVNDGNILRAIELLRLAHGMEPDDKLREEMGAVLKVLEDAETFP